MRWSVVSPNIRFDHWRSRRIESVLKTALLKPLHAIRSIKTKGVYFILIGHTRWVIVEATLSSKYHERFVFGPELAHRRARLQANAVKGTPGPRGYNVALAERSEEKTRETALDLQRLASSTQQRMRRTTRRRICMKLSSFTRASWPRTQTLKRLSTPDRRSKTS